MDQKHDYSEYGASLRVAGGAILFCTDIHTAEDTGDEAEKNPDFQAEIFCTLFLYASCHDWTISDHVGGNPLSVIKSRDVSGRGNPKVGQTHTVRV